MKAERFGAPSFFCITAAFRAICSEYPADDAIVSLFDDLFASINAMI
jgi:hypothetical protein